MSQRLKPTQVLRFTRLKLVNWRNFREIEVGLQKRVFFIGPNASGKSNILDSMLFLSDLARPGSGGVQAAIDTRGGFSAIRCLHAKTTNFVEFNVDIGNDENEAIWTYSLRLNVRKSEKLPTIENEEIRKEGKLIKQQVRKAANLDALDFSQTLLEQVKSGKEFRDLVLFLASCRYTHVVPQIVRDRLRARAEGADPFGGDLLRRIKEMPKKTRDPRLRRVSDALKIAVPQFEKLELRDDSEGKPHLYASYVHWRAHASKQPESAFSDGTLRLIGLLWAVAERGGPLLLEEPELSLNDDVVRQLPRLFQTMQRLSGRQVIATTHSIALLDGVGIGLSEVHIITVDTNGSHINTASGDKAIVAEVDNGLPVSQAVIPRVQPKGVEKLGLFYV